MFKESTIHLDKVFEILKEIESYAYYKEQINQKLDDIFTLYQNKKIDSIRYDHLKNKILRGKTRKEINDYYNNYIILLLKQARNYNTLIFDDIYNADIKSAIQVIKYAEHVEMSVKEHAEEPVKEIIEKPVVKAEHATAEDVSLPAESSVEDIIPVLEIKPEVVEKAEMPEKSGEAKSEILFDRHEKAPEIKIKHSHIKADIKKPGIMDSIRSHFKALRIWIDHFFEKLKEEAEQKKISLEEKKKEKRKHAIMAKPEQDAGKKDVITTITPKKSTFKWIIEILSFRKKSKLSEMPESESAEPAEKISTEKLSFMEKLQGRFSIKWKKKDEIIPKEFKDKLSLGIGVEKVSVKSIIQDWFNNTLKGKKRYIADDTLISPSLIRLTDVSYHDFQRFRDEKGVDPEHLLKEAERIKKRLAKKKSTPIYKPMLLGSIANVTVRPLTNWLISRFPDFFKNLYYQLRLANIQVLSNTYLNIMVFASSNIFVFSFLIYTILSILRFQPLIFALVTGLAVGIACAGVTFMSFYYYPNTIIAKRRKSIKTNMPFGINHIAAIASSGIPPTTMFKLIAESMEYAELCIELQKIVDYIELFGYNLVTAIKAVSEITPDEQLREFFEGMINTIESGGDLEKYLMQKSKEAMGNYELERRKYAETVATYSDIYTGVLIAAPLFFVASLTLVSMLGGSIGGYNISTIIGLATYLLIPTLNIGFIVFLNISQPEV